METENPAAPEYGTREFFAGAARRPFGAGGPGFSIRDAWWLAECALLAYVDDIEYVVAVLRAAGLPQVAQIGSGSGMAMLAAGPRDLIVAFRGTECDDLAQLWSNLRLGLTPFAGGKVHTGFHAAHERLHEDLARRVAAWRKGRRLWFTGHSLGGALAILHTAVTDDVHALYTFGSPRVGDADFAGGIETPAYRVAHRDDIVAQLPPLDSYHHVGTPHRIGRSGGIHAGPTPWLTSLLDHADRLQRLFARFAEHSLEEILSEGMFTHAQLQYADRLADLA